MGNLFLHLWCVNFLKRKAVLKNSTFSCFYFPKRPVSAAVSKFYSADFGLYLFYLHKVPCVDKKDAGSKVQACKHFWAFFRHLPKLCAKSRMLPTHSLNGTDSSGFC